jgi:CubicO group peptidase (beta-lactamase class C family)
MSPVLAALALALVAGAPSADDARFAAETRAHFARLEKLGFAGVVLVARGREPFLAEGFGLADRERGIRWSPATVSTVGSITKQFTAAAVLLLVEDGRLSLDDALPKHFDDVPADKRGITIHHLLTHSSGITDLSGAGDWDPIGREEFARRALGEPLAFTPGEGYEYSNAGYSLLGAVIEKLSGLPYERFVRDRLFLPNGLFETGYLLPAWGDGRLAVGYRRGERWGTVLERPMAADGPFWVLRANGGIHSTAWDMLRWGRALLEGGVISPASLDRLWAPHVSEGGDTHYGYGWVVARGPGGEKVVTHNGGNGILFADLALVPGSDLFAFVQTNVLADAPVSNRLLEQIGARLLAGAAYPAVPDVVSADPSALAAVAAEYALDGGGRLRIEARDGVLVAEPVDPAGFRTMLSTEPPDPARAERLSARIDAIVGACRRGDFGPLSAAYGGRVTAERLRERWTEETERLAGESGALRGHRVLGTARQGDRDVTVVRLEFERGSVDWAYVWDPAAEESLRGRSVRGLEPCLRFHPTGPDRYGSWDGGLTPSKPLVVERGGDGTLRLRLGEGPTALHGSASRSSR